MPLTDKVVLVTAAGRDLGLALAQGLGGAGARVVVNDVNPDAAEAAAAGIAAAGGRALARSADVANKLAIQTLHYEILDTWGRVDVLVNTAVIQPAGDVLTLDEWAWNRALDVNLKGAFLCSQTVGRAMKEQGGGLILNLLGQETGTAVHAASQAGLLGFTRRCAAEFASYSIRVHALRPAPGGATGAVVAAALRLCDGAAADLIVDC